MRVEEIGAGNETRTRDPNLGKVVLYQLSYSRIEERYFNLSFDTVKIHLKRTGGRRNTQPTQSLSAAMTGNAARK